MTNPETGLPNEKSRANETPKLPNQRCFGSLFGFLYTREVSLKVESGLVDENTPTSLGGWLQ